LLIGIIEQTNGSTKNTNSEQKAVPSEVDRSTEEASQSSEQPLAIVSQAKTDRLTLSCMATHLNGVSFSNLRNTEVGSSLDMQSINQNLLFEDSVATMANFDRTAVYTSNVSYQYGLVSFPFSDNGSDGTFVLDPEKLTAKATIESNQVVDFTCSKNDALTGADFIKNAPLPQEYQAPQTIEFKATKNYKGFDRHIYPEIEATNLSDNISLTKIIVNRGNCSIFFVYKFPSGETMPLDLVYGDKIMLRADCDPSEVTFVTDQGSTTIRW